MLSVFKSMLAYEVGDSFQWQVWIRGWHRNIPNVASRQPRLVLG